MRPFGFSLLLLMLPYCSNFKYSDTWPTPQGGDLHKNRATLPALKLGERKFIDSWYRDNFNYPAEAQNIYNKNVMFFNGTTDNNDPVAGRKVLNPPDDLSREALRVRICHTTLKSDDSMMHKLQQVFGDNFDISNLLEKPDGEEIQMLYDSFYLGREADNGVIQSLQNLSNTAASESSSTKESWRHLLLLFCLSPDWQVI